MKRWKKILFTTILIFLITGLACALYLWNKPRRNVTHEKGIQISAVAIFDSFSNNEAAANASFLNKAIEVTGTVSNVKKNQVGVTVIILKSNDPIYGVNCTFKQDPGAIEKGSTITFKGICTGYLGEVDKPGDVIINEGIIVK